MCYLQVINFTSIVGVFFCFAALVWIFFNFSILDPINFCSFWLYICSNIFLHFLFLICLIIILLILPPITILQYNIYSRASQFSIRGPYSVLHIIQFLLRGNTKNKWPSTKFKFMQPDTTDCNQVWADVILTIETYNMMCPLCVKSQLMC
jgi:hypothetical protein